MWKTRIKISATWPGLFLYFIFNQAMADITETAVKTCSADPPLREVLASDEAKHLRLSDSNGLVTPQMRAIGNPEGPIEDRLSTWLSLYDLGLLKTESGNLLITLADTAPDVISGQLLDEQGQPLVHATIQVAGRNASVRTSASGCFLMTGLTLDASEQVIRVTGFQPYRLAPDGNRWRTIQLAADTGPAIETVVVIGSSHQMMRGELASQNFLDREEIERFPHLGDDITRVFRHLPGAASGDFSPKIHVRGGEKNELAMVVDGLELHQPWYFKSMDGLGSIIDSNIIASVDVLSGGFTADYGGKTSAVTEIETLAPEDIRPTVGVSFLTAFGQTGGTFKNGDGGWITSLRSGYLDLAFDLAGSDADVQPRFYDVFSKVDIGVNDNNRLIVNLLAANDSLRFDSGYQGEDREFTDDSSSNNNLWINLKTDIGDKLQTTNSVSLTAFEYRLLGYMDEPNLIWQDDRKYDAWGLKSDWSAALSRNHLFKWGVEVKKVQADYDYYLAVSVSPYDDNSMHYINTFRTAQLYPEGQDRAAYAAYRFRLLNRLTTEIGGRWSEQTYTGLEEDVLFSPRVNLVYDLTDASRINASWGVFRQPQGIDELSPGDGDTMFHPSQEAEHAILGLRHTVNANWDFRLEIYRKDYDQLIPRYENLYEDIERFVNEAADDRIRLAPDRAVAEGAELSINYNSHAHFSAWANYSYSEVNDYFAGEPVPRSWDQRHAANFSLNWERGEWSFNLSGMIRSGWPTTPVVLDSRRPRNDNAVRPDTDRYNTERLDGYSRFDTRLTKSKILKNGDLFQYYIEIYNLLDSENPCCTDYELDYRGEVVPDFENWLPLMPSFGLRYTF